MTQIFYGTKQIKAKPMNRLEYNNFRLWVLPADENGEDEGYLVEYLDGGKPNVEGYAGYVSWSPKEQFDNAYMSAEAIKAATGIIIKQIGDVSVSYSFKPVEQPNLGESAATAPEEPAGAETAAQESVSASAEVQSLGESVEGADAVTEQSAGVSTGELEAPPEN